MTHAELYAITAQGPAVIMVARDDMLALLARVERVEVAAVAAFKLDHAEAGLCAPGQHPKQLCAQASDMMRQRDAARDAMAYDEHHPGFIAGVKAGEFASGSKIAAAVAEEREAIIEGMEAEAMNCNRRGYLTTGTLHQMEEMKASALWSYASALRARPRHEP